MIVATLVVSGYIYDFYVTLLTIGSAGVISVLFFKYQFKQLSMEFTKVAKGKSPIDQIPRLVSLHNTIILDVDRVNSESQLLPVHPGQAY